MKNLLVIFFVAISISGCVSPLVNAIGDADSLVVVFHRQGDLKTVNTTNKVAINRLIDFADAGKTKETNCLQQGTMTFFAEQEELLQVDFYRDADSCRYFAYTLQGQRHFNKMNNEAADFLESLEEGKSTY